MKSKAMLLVVLLAPPIGAWAADDCGAPAQNVTNETYRKAMAEQDRCSSNAESTSIGLSLPDLPGIDTTNKTSSDSCMHSANFEEARTKLLIQALTTNESLLIDACGYRACMLERIHAGSSEFLKSLCSRVNTPTKPLNPTVTPRLQKVGFTEAEAGAQSTQTIYIDVVGLSNKPATVACKHDRYINCKVGEQSFYEGDDGKVLKLPIEITAPKHLMRGKPIVQHYTINLNNNTDLPPGFIEIVRSDAPETCLKWENDKCTACLVDLGKPGIFHVPSGNDHPSTETICTAMRPGPASLQLHGGLQPDGSRNPNNLITNWGSRWKLVANSNNCRDQSLVAEDSRPFGNKQPFAEAVDWPLRRIDIPLENTTFSVGICIVDASTNITPMQAPMEYSFPVMSIISLPTH